MGRARAKKLQFFCYPAYSLEEEVLLQTNGGKCAVWRVLFGAFKLPDFNNLKCGNPKPKKIFRFQIINVIFPVQHGKIQWIQWWNYFSSLIKRGRDIARKLGAWVAPGRTNMTLIIVTASATWLCRMDAHHEYSTHTHTHSVLTAIFPGEPGLAGCPLNSPSPFIPGLCILLGQT